MSEATVPNPEFDSKYIAIERATPDDAEIICDIRDQARLDTYPNSEMEISIDDIRLIIQGPEGEFRPRRIAYYKKQIDDSIDLELGIYVAKMDGHVVGFTRPITDEGGRQCIGDMFVAPEAQSKGVGGKLMRHVLSLFDRDQDIYLEVVSYNDNAIGFYKRFGFEQTDAVVQPEEGRPEYLKSLPQIEMVLKAGIGNE